MGYIRGHRGDYDRWASQGLPGWSYDEVLPYFKRAETWEDGETPYRGGDGPIYVRRTRGIDPALRSLYCGRNRRRPSLHRRTTTRRATARRSAGRSGPSTMAGATKRAICILRSAATASHGRDLRWRDGSCSKAAAPSASTTARMAPDRRAGDAPEVIVSAGSINTAASDAVGHRRSEPRAPVRDRANRAACPALALACKTITRLGCPTSGAKSGPFVTATTRVDRLAFNFARAYLAGTGPATDVPSGFMAFVKTDPGLAMPDIQFLFRSGPRRRPARGFPASSRQSAMPSYAVRCCCGQRAGAAFSSARRTRPTPCIHQEIFSATNAICRCC